MILIMLLKKPLKITNEYKDLTGIELKSGKYPTYMLLGTVLLPLGCKIQALGNCYCIRLDRKN